MDFQQLMSLASQNQMKAERKLPSSKKYSTQVSAPKKIQKVRVESDALKKLRKEKEKEKHEKERNQINDHITERIKEQKRREDAIRDKRMARVRGKGGQTDTEKGKVRNDKQIERAKERRENIDEKNLTPKMKEKLKEERLREKLREIKLRDKQEIQQTEGMATAESKKEGFKIPRGSSDGPKSSLTNEKSAKVSSIVTAGARPLYKIVPKDPENSSKAAPKKPVTKAPPPLDFNSLMKLASKKASDTKSAASVTTTASKNPLNRPMTQLEKERHQRMTSKQFKEWYKYGTSPPRPDSPTEEIKKDRSGGDKVRKKETIDSNRKDKRPSDSSTLEKKRSDSVNGDPKRKSSSSDSKISSKSKNGGDDLADKYKQLELKYKALEEQMKRQATYNEKKPSKPSGQKSSSSSSNHTSNSQKKPVSSKSSGGKYVSENDNLLVCRPVAPEKPKSAWDRIYDQIQKTDPVKKPVKRKRVIDSEEEEEEDLAGFIDDEPLEDEYSSNYSKCIREIFGYDKRKFRYDEEDDDDMETSYAQQMKEEIRSTKIGILEDLEDIRLEKEENKKKKGKLKP